MLNWIIAVFALAALYVALGKFLRRRDLRAIAVVELPEDHAPLVTFEPSLPTQEDLIRLCLVYGSKLWWVILSEPKETQDLFKGLFREALDSWFEGSPLLTPELCTN